MSRVFSQEDIPYLFFDILNEAEMYPQDMYVFLHFNLASKRQALLYWKVLNRAAQIKW